MKVLLTCKKKNWCGEMRYIAELAGALATTGFAVTVGAPGESEIWERLPAGIRRLVLHLRHDFLALRRLGSDILSLRPVLKDVDVVHSNASWDTWLAAWARSAFRIRTPLVRTRHNLKPIRRHPGNRWLYGRAIDTVVAPSRTILEDTSSSAMVPASSLRLVRHAVDAANFDPARLDAGACRKRLRLQIGAREDSPVVVLAGRLVRRKRPDLFIRAALDLCRQGVDAHFILVGRRAPEDPFNRELLELAALNPDRIHFLDFTSAMDELLAGCDVAVHCADREPFGLAVLEAMSMEVPVAASASGGPLEMIEDGTEGLFFPPGNVEACARTLISLLEDPGRRREMGKRGRIRVLREFSWERCLAEHLEIYRGLRQSFATRNGGRS